MKEWLVKRNVDTAMRYVSARPVLGKCARSPALTGKKRVSPEEYKVGVEWILVQVTKWARPGRTLADVIQPMEITPPMEQNIARGEPFVLFSLAYIFDDAAFICKFDDDVEFPRAFASPNVWYLVFKLKVPESPYLSFILAWRKEGEEWRLFSLGPLED